MSKENAAVNAVLVEKMRKKRHGGGGGGGATPLYQVYRYVPPQRVWFLSRFSLKTGIDLNILV